MVSANSNISLFRFDESEGAKMIQLRSKNGFHVDLWKYDIAIYNQIIISCLTLRILSHTWQILEALSRLEKQNDSHYPIIAQPLSPI